MLAVFAELKPLAGAFKVASAAIGDPVGLGGIALARELPERVYPATSVSKLYGCTSRSSPARIGCAIEPLLLLKDSRRG
jgi:hypothetical protein